MDKGFYHTALKGGEPSVEYPACSRAVFPGGVAIRHDITFGLHPEMGECQALYADPPWPAGFEVFNERAQTPGGTWKGFMAKIGKIIAESKKPIFLTLGMRALGLLPGADNVFHLRLNHADVLLGVWNAPDVEVRGKCTAFRFLEMLVERYECIGDFCCGYGTTGRVFLGAGGKRVILTDYNARCIGRIGQIAGDWKK